MSTILNVALVVFAVFVGTGAKLPQKKQTKNDRLLPGSQSATYSSKDNKHSMKVNFFSSGSNEVSGLIRENGRVFVLGACDNLGGDCQVMAENDPNASPVQDRQISSVTPTTTTVTTTTVTTTTVTTTTMTTTTETTTTETTTTMTTTTMTTTTTTTVTTTVSPAKVINECVKTAASNVLSMGAPYVIDYPGSGNYGDSVYCLWRFFVKCSIGSRGIQDHFDSYVSFTHLQCGTVLEKRRQIRIPAPTSAKNKIYLQLWKPSN
ncbi:hypothetical protein TCAL_16016 [Tigriopus californicus]|uniref:CUB domain-containing protein n=1 Tax=Tigriopus californicus TaxID=6832 RepID=A0A553PQK9_TIGCA|nr:hypothetical protein TCAL_16016 [Tigriopus californicus]